MAIRRTSVERAADEVRRQRSKLSDLEAQKQACESELLALQSRAGIAVLDDESGDAVARISKSIGEYRDQVQVLASAIGSQVPRIRAAEAAYLNAEADEYERPLAAARAALVRHEAITADLLRQLEAHEGRHVSDVQLLETFGAAQRDGMSFEAPKSWALNEAVDAATQPVEILRALAHGETPKVPAGDNWPPCVWGPDALVPAPEYLRAVEHAKGRVANLDGQLEHVEARIAELNADPAHGTGGDNAQAVGQWLMENTIKRERIAADRDQAAAALAAMTTTV